MSENISVTSHNGENIIMVGKHENKMLNLIMNFNPFLFLNFIQSVQHDYHVVSIKSIEVYDTEASGMAVMLNNTFDFNGFISNLSTHIETIYETATSPII